MGLFGSKINKITATHAEAISDKDIVYNIMSSTDAKRNFSREEFHYFMQLFNKIASEKTPFLANAEKYTNRAFSIAYTFEQEGFPYEYCHGTASDVYGMYVARKPLFDQAVEQFVENYESIMNNIIEDNDSDEQTVMLYSAVFLMYAMKGVANYGGMRCSTDYLPFYFDTVQAEYLNKTIADYAHDDAGKEKMTQYLGEIRDLFKKNYDEGETFEGFMHAYAKDFMSCIGAGGDEENYELLVEEIDMWIDEAEQYASEQ